MYIILNYDQNLYSINLSTGALTVEFDTGVDMNSLTASMAAPPQPATVPTMTEWGMIIFMVLAGLGSLYYLRRKRIEG